MYPTLSKRKKHSYKIAGRTTKINYIKDADLILRETTPFSCLTRLAIGIKSTIPQPGQKFLYL
jgi:hypothetical protein